MVKKTYKGHAVTGLIFGIIGLVTAYVSIFSFGNLLYPDASENPLGIALVIVLFLPFVIAILAASGIFTFISLILGFVSISKTEDSSTKKVAIVNLVIAIVSFVVLLITLFMLLVKQYNGGINAGDSTSALDSIASAVKVLVL